MRVDHTASDYAARAVLTPVTVAADGVLMVVGFSLILVLLHVGAAYQGITKRD